MNHLITISLVAAAFLGAPTLAGAQPTAYANGPIAVTSCTIEPQIDALSFVGPISRGSELLRNAYDVSIGFTNTSSMPASSITFVLDNGGRKQIVVADADLAPGASAAESFTANVDPQPAETSACTVARVRFADGQVWDAPGLSYDEVSLL
jgi:hypothetical protein